MPFFKELGNESRVLGLPLGKDLPTSTSSLCWMGATCGWPPYSDVTAVHWKGLPRSFWDRSYVPLKAGDSCPPSQSINSPLSPLPPGLWDSVLKPYPTSTGGISQKPSLHPGQSPVRHGLRRKKKEEGEGSPAYSCLPGKRFLLSNPSSVF